jgi:hypothetical protein
MSQENAQKEYVDLISKIDPSFVPPASSTKSRAKTAKASEAAAAAAATKTALSNASTMLPPPPFEVNDQVFNAAFEKVNELKWELDAADKLGLYGLYKQVIIIIVICYCYLLFILLFNVNVFADFHDPAVSLFAVLCLV